MRKRVLIEGDGVAARCCGLLLERAGFELGFEAAGRPRVPAIMLSDAAVELMRSVFERPEMLLHCPRVRKRIVAWGADANAVALDHSAVVISEERLLTELSGETAAAHSGDYRVVASGPLPCSVFGTRLATATRVLLKDNAEPAACWMESLPEGWLFLVTDAPGRGWLLSVGSPAESRLVFEQIAEFGTATGGFPASPRIASALGGKDWLACGSAAMGFDPICGDGTAHAVREAVLCSAVIRGWAGGGDVESLTNHYQARLMAAFRRHLEMCLSYYESGGNSDWWKREAEALREGLANLEPPPPFRYRLNDFELEPA